MPTELGNGTVNTISISDLDLVNLRANLGIGKASSKLYSNVTGTPKNTINLSAIKLSIANSKVEGSISAFAIFGTCNCGSKVNSNIGDLILTPPIVEPTLKLWIAKADNPNLRADLDGYSMAIGDSLSVGIELTGERLENLTLSLEALDIADNTVKLTKATGGDGITLSEVMPVSGNVGKRTGYFTFSATETAVLSETITQLQLVLRVSDGSGYRYTFAPVTISLYSI